MSDDLKKKRKKKCCLYSVSASKSVCFCAVGNECYVPGMKNAKSAEMGVL